jgi:glyoxylase-like metal-dependent hydrolase (beta-lactamase superfamily II)
VHFGWESLTDSVRRCRLPFLDVTVGLVQGTAGALLVDSGTTLTEAHAIDDDVRLIAGCSVKHVVLTHKHFDHVLGSGGFADAQINCAPEVFDYLTTEIAQLRDDAPMSGPGASC